jgi:molybdopterin-guanine dinucleotide biosynthesis protein A
MVDRVGSKSVVVPRYRGELEPLHAIYSKGCLTEIKKMIDENILKVSDLFSRVSVEEVSEEAVSRVDPSGESFLNVNNRDDANSLLESQAAALKG